MKQLNPNVVVIAITVLIIGIFSVNKFSPQVAPSPLPDIISVDRTWKTDLIQEIPGEVDRKRISYELYSFADTVKWHWPRASNTTLIDLKDLEYSLKETQRIFNKKERPWSEKYPKGSRIIGDRLSLVIGANRKLDQVTLDLYISTVEEIASVLDGVSYDE